MWLAIVFAAITPITFAQSPATQSAHEYPNKPVHLIVPYGPGGPSDIMARLFSERLTANLGQPVIVENRPGAGSSIGTRIVAEAAPNGYTMILSDTPHAINPAVFEKVPYDPIKDFTPITLVARTPYFLFVNSSQPVKNAREFVMLAKTQPGKITVASGGNGTVAHLIIALLEHATNIKVTHVPYNGAARSIPAAASGEVAAVITSMPAAVPFVRSGQLRPVAISYSDRHPEHPDIPTFEESGVSDMVLQGWWGILAPAGLPKAIQMKLHKAFVDAVNDRTLRERFSKLLIEPVTSSPEELGAVIESDLRRWSKLAKEAGIKLQ
jgi:tripartite-type tricarboxylate transporter receptor subunit TctC